MLFKSFQTKVYGKWILAGDAYNLWDGSAVALPCTEFFAEIEFHPEETERLSLIGQDDEVNLKALVAAGLEFLNLDGSSTPKGRLILRSNFSPMMRVRNLPVFCVAIARWLLSERKDVQDADIINLAGQIEQTTHGSRSDLHLSVSHLNRPVFYSKNGGLKLIDIGILPKFNVNNRPSLSVDHSECSELIREFIQTNPQKWKETQLKMQKAVEFALIGLEGFGRPETLFTSCQALDMSLKLSNECMEQWGMISPYTIQLEN